MAGIVAALDADVLVPILACDFLLTAFDHGLYEPVISATVLAEVQRALRNDFPKLDGAAITYRVDAMRDVLADHLVEPELADLPTAVNVKDQHLAAAAIAGEASVVVTNDRRLRGQIKSGVTGLVALTLDEFAHSLAEHDAETVSSVIDTLVSKRTLHL